jgi:hypothetical protein
MSQRLLIDNIKKNHRRFHLFFVLIIATAVTFGFYQLTLIGSQITDAQTSLPVVPGAYGFGMNTRAAYACGVDPVILKVTSLADSGAGTLRAALNDTRPRIIVFEISGTIALNSYIDFTSPCVTIAGQTAPSPGILIKNYSLKINARDVLVQHLRFRPGWDAQAMNCNKGLIVAEDTVDVYNVVMDHISGSWAAGKVYTIGDYRTTRDITFWRSISAEGLYQPYDQLDNYGQYTQCGSSAPDPAYGMLIVPVTNMSVLQSIFKDHLERNPVTGGDASLYVANNVIHGFGQGTAWGVDPYYYPRWPGKMTVIGNVYRYSSKINQYGTDAAIQAYLKASWNCEPGFRCIDGSNPNDNLQLYYSDNKKDIKYPGLSIYDARAFEWDPAACQGYCDYNLPSMSTKPIDLPGYPVLPSSQVFDLVLNNAGARPADRAIEKVDEGIINDIRTFADFRFVNAEDPKAILTVECRILQ